ncbi:MAG: hypothetical protein ACYTFW_15820 [Planctomycetota bacterium]|jgi:hypothetical protein
MNANTSAKPVEIRVAQSTYKPDQGNGVTDGDCETTFGLMNGVTLKGGYAGDAFGLGPPCVLGSGIYALPNACQRAPASTVARPAQQGFGIAVRMKVRKLYQYHEVLPNL